MQKGAYEEGKEVEITGTISVVYYASPKWSSGKMITNAGDIITFNGNIYAIIGQPVIAKGKFVRDLKFGLQFKIESCRVEIPTDVNGLAMLLEKCPDVKGIGAVKSKLIAEYYGPRLGGELSNNPQGVAKVAKLPLEKVALLAAWWKKNEQTMSVQTALAAYELSYHQVQTLVEKYGDNTLAILKGDPYSMLHAIPKFGFKRIDGIALKAGIEKDNSGRVRAVIIYCIKEVMSSTGSTWIAHKRLLKVANDLLIMDTIDSRNIINALIKTLIDEKILTHSKLEGDSDIRISIKEVMECEERLAVAFRRAGEDVTHSKTFNSEKYIKENTLNPKQIKAVHNAINKKISVISGGAGTGKSHTIATISSIISDAKATTYLAAPTGKAARRIEELCGDNGEASTIHRLLGWDGHSFTMKKNVKLSADFIILDEVSMIDIQLMDAFFDAVDLNKTSVVLVGDHNQLPPIGAGNILRDLMLSENIPVTILTENIRAKHANTLKENCRSILDGVVAKSRKEKDVAFSEWLVARNLTEPIAVQDTVKKLYETRLEEMCFSLDDVQVLTPTHKGEIGTMALNKILQRIVQKKKFGVTVPETDKSIALPLIGDKIIYNVNNYDANIMNGSIGTMIGTKDELGNFIVKFEGKDHFLDKTKANDISLAYALTIHKVQGSEFQCAVVVCHKSHSFMHHRGLLYTGVTRARKCSIILGDNWGINNCVKIVKTDQRKTMLADLLAQK